MSWFKKKPIQLQVVRREQHKLRLNEWRQDPQLCATAAKMLGDPNLQLMLQVLWNEHPLHTVLSLGASLEDRAVQQARAEGYEMFLANLEALAVNTVPVPLPESVFETV